MPASKKTVVEDDVYEMEDILAFRIDDNNQEQWLVKWKGYDDPCDQTWEPRNNFLNPGVSVAGKLEHFRKQYYEKKSRKRGATAASTATKELKTERSRKTRKTLDEEASAPAAEPTRLSPKAKPAQNAPPAIAQEEKPTGPQGDVTVSHIGKGGGSNPKDYVVSLRWSNGYERQAKVGEVRSQYAAQLLDYLLSRVRFRDERPH